MALQCLQHTPSVYFNFDDASNNNSNTNEFLFDLSCTNEKADIKTIAKIDPSILDLGQNVSKPFFQRLKTEQFFYEFDSHFVVTFQEGSKQAFTNLESTAVFASQKDSPDLNLINEKHISQVFMNTNISIQSNFRKQPSQEQMKQRIIQTTSSFIRQEIQQSKDKQSPIPAFQVKKRTVFKNRQNIVSNAQHFKITKKKIINQNTLQTFFSQPKSDKLYQKSQFTDFQACLTSKIPEKLQVSKKYGKQNMEQIMEKKVIGQRKSKSTIFQGSVKSYRQNFRSTTLDNWKRKFNRKKKSQQQTVRRLNIFQKPFSLN